MMIYEINHKILSSIKITMQCNGHTRGGGCKQKKILYCNVVLRCGEIVRGDIIEGPYESFRAVCFFFVNIYQFCFLEKKNESLGQLNSLGYS